MTLADHAPLLERAFTLDLREDSYPVEDIEGEVPGFLRGSYYLNGPSSFERGAVRYRHWLDGDGMVSSLRFTAGGVTYTNRFVASTKRTEEEAAGKALYRTFGTSFAGDRLVRGIALASPVNVSVYPFAGTLLAFGEQGLPWELDPVTLETRGEYTFGRRLNAISPFSAHAAFDPDSGEMINFGVSFSARQPMINFYRFAAGGELLLRRRLPIEHPVSVHDFTIGPRHAVVYLSPYVLDMEKLAGGGATLLQSLAWRPELGSRLLIAERETGEAVASVPVGSGYCLHLIGCFERAGRLVVDVIELERPIYDQYDVPDLFTEVRRAQPVRYVVNIDRGEVEERIGFDYRQMCDFPAIDPRLVACDYRHFWVLGISNTELEGRKFFDRVVHCDWNLGKPAGIYQAPPGHYLGGEPVFAADPRDPSVGAVICQSFDAEREVSWFLIFDAFDVARGPVAKLRLRHPVPLGFHATYHQE